MASLLSLPSIYGQPQSDSPKFQFTENLRFETETGRRGRRFRLSQNLSGSNCPHLTFGGLFLSDALAIKVVF
ncbi:uncharacterized protein G2W53_020855 [Senna tora]|uniref:Uncharacterized protein n=1 Tax=Senna tora TaxID=362788 RepID=A0A834WKJ1_9FABA|nr:uncharacterized protein G2W53_020855 [Senna tora]